MKSDRLILAGKILEVTAARPYLPSLVGREEETLGSLFRDVEKVFEEFSRRPPFAFGVEASGLPGPKIDIAGTKDAIDVTAELPGVEEKDIELTLAKLLGLWAIYQRAFVAALPPQIHYA